MPTNIVIVGNLGCDPEVRTTNSGLEIVELRIASQDGKDKTSWWTAKFLGNKHGETAKKFAKKGSSVMVGGLADEEVWEKDGKKNSKIVVIAHSFNFLGSKSDGAPKAEGKPAAKTASKEESEDSSENIPF